MVLINYSKVISSFVKFKEQQAKGKQSGTRTVNINVPKLKDASEAGKKGSSKDCTLILTEGDSAKSLGQASRHSQFFRVRFMGRFTVRSRIRVTVRFRVRITLKSVQ